MSNEQHNLIRLWLWLAVVLLCLAFAATRWQYDHQHRANLKSWERQRIQRARAGEKMRNRIRNLFRSQSFGNNRQPSISKAELEAKFNGGRPFNLTKRGNLRIARWKDPNSGLNVEFDFNSDNGWTGWGSSLSNVHNVPQPTRAPFDQFTHKIQRLFAGSFSLGIGTVAWLVAIALYIVWKKQRQALSEIMLALTLMCGTAWLMWPSYYLTLSGIFSNDMLFWAVLMLMTSTIALFAAYRKVLPPPWPVCKHCDYNLTGNVSGTCPECGGKITPS